MHRKNQEPENMNYFLYVQQYIERVQFEKYEM